MGRREDGRLGVLEDTYLVQHACPDGEVLGVAGGADLRHRPELGHRPRVVLRELLERKINLVGSMLSWDLRLRGRFPSCPVRCREDLGTSPFVVYSLSLIHI